MFRELLLSTLALLLKSVLNDGRLARELSAGYLVGLAVKSGVAYLKQYEK